MGEWRLAKRSDGGLGMVGRSGWPWCSGIDRGAGSPIRRVQGRPLRQAQGRVSGDAGLTGMCSVGWGDVFSFWANVFTFRPEVSTFRPNVSTLVGQVSSYGRRSRGAQDFQVTCTWPWGR